MDNLQIAKKVLGDRLKNVDAVENLSVLKDKILDISKRMDESDELGSLLHGFDGKYIPSGPSGLISRGRDDVLPTGRNFYSLDPQRVPTKASYEIGKRLGDAIIEKYRKDTEKIPENIAIVWWAGDIMWADGEVMSKIMHLIGVKPKWMTNGRVNGFEVIPLEDLKRPRIDVTIRVSGITRDCFPNAIELVDEAIKTVAQLNEPTDKNFIRKHSLEQFEQLKTKNVNGKEKNNTSNGENSENELSLWQDATTRIFSSMPGTYSAGTQFAVYASAWKEDKDLSDVFVYFNGYAYGKGVFGKKAHKQFVNNLKTVDATAANTVTDEYDIFGCCCHFGTEGGLCNAAKHISGKDVKFYHTDTRDPARVFVGDLADEIKRVVRTKILNPKWIEGQKKHGYKGAGDISKRIGRIYGYSATTKLVDKWIFDDIAKTFVMDKEMREWFNENNPWALEEIERRLLEAAQRKLWDVDEDMLNKLKEHYMELEGIMEEKMGDVEGDYQGGAIDIFTDEDVGDWKVKMDEIRKKVMM